MPRVNAASVPTSRRCNSNRIPLAAKSSTRTGKLTFPKTHLILHCHDTSNPSHRNPSFRPPPNPKSRNPLCSNIYSKHTLLSDFSPSHGTLGNLPFGTSSPTLVSSLMFITMDLGTPLSPLCERGVKSGASTALKLRMRTTLDPRYSTL